MLSRLQQIFCPPKSLDDYKRFTPDTVKQIKHLAKPLKGLKIVHLNATAQGGGVAEMLRPEVALQQDIGLNSSLYIIPPNLEFFEVTKKIHNFLQGQPGRLTDQERKTYLQYSRLIAQALSALNPQPDIIFIHDPQPAASISFFNNLSIKTLWRCHIDTSSLNKDVWSFLTAYLKPYSHFIFTHPDYLQKSFLPLSKVSFITPVIDPLAPKNIPMDKGKAKQYLKQYGINPNQPLITQVSRLDPWKDPLGVMDAYRMAKTAIPDLQLALVAQSANDDPEGERMYTKVKNYIKKEKGIFLLQNLPDNDRAVNAFQTASDIVLQKSIREGFGLTVTEAMWKGTVVIAGNVGGIRLQIKNGVNGFLINSTKETAENIVHILQYPKAAARLSKTAHQSVTEKFLLPHAILNYLHLFKSFPLPLPLWT